ncbi:hypothetical protein, partial [Caballeronia pedi]|uniref:hypothetical protein n=1 Tax=Caballeronia pedi TaxID=1777141 RepID=UPI0011773F9A
RLEQAVSLVTFFAAAKKVTAAPHRGNTNRPTRKRDPAKNQANDTKANPHRNDARKHELAPKPHHKPNIPSVKNSPTQASNPRHSGISPPLA